MATSDLHIGHQDNRRIVEDIRPEHPDDWLIVAGDVADRVEDIDWTLRLLKDHFTEVIWVPGNHELWTPGNDPVELRGVRRYEHLVQVCRGLGVHTPEDPYPVWRGAGGPVTVAPLFLLYDYTFRPEGTLTRETALAKAYEAGVVCTDEYLLHPDPYPTLDAWGRARVEETERRLEALPADTSTVLINHWPMTRDPTRILRYPEFALWCGTESTADWHVRFNAAAVVYGHLHIPRTTFQNGVRFEEVSLGYPREWKPRGLPRGVLRTILPG
ncbi:putative phosphohydrolase [Actinoalloteichus hymeniacidonis]|uniref:Phosphohydrolase n=1 Tax=Actinoalloteichus hymeniacidonis TaxID=340345 RepID=A0AAC9HPU9_9PSEU|nr:putative phosphohydrolase [Actinoalloteichus hymeniacidonis]